MPPSSIEAGRLTVGERPNTPRAIGERLRALVAVAALPTDAVVNITGASEGHVLGWLEGRQVPPRDRISRLARQAGVTVAWIYYGEEAGLPPQIASLLRRALAHNNEDPPSGRSPAGPA
jgi:hypothetical protein